MKPEDFSQFDDPHVRAVMVAAAKLVEAMAPLERGEKPMLSMYQRSQDLKAALYGARPKMYPILGHSICSSIPVSLLEGHRARAMKNHGQTLEQLADRGGLALQEALAIINDVAWSTYQNMPDEEALRLVLASRRSST